uniref:Small ribosomal subunit protein uS3m n=1 Tax=Schizosaccharomyces cryophilus TaxID=866546 RepID=A0A411K8W9_9SCHI|nr:ribosomal protein S3 [Schizosaccharomyces cryophilus]QBC74713.1 ribosomal protein S3 [Schizosaccharomyces cryophilus]
MNFNKLKAISSNFLNHFFANNSSNFAIGHNDSNKPTLLLGKMELLPMFNSNSKVIYALQFPYFNFNRMNNEDSDNLFLYVEWKLNLIIKNELANINLNNGLMNSSLTIKLMPYEMETPYSDSLILAKYTAWIFSANKKYTKNFLKDPLAFMNIIDNNLPLNTTKVKHSSVGLNNVTLKGIKLNYNLIKPNIIAQKGNTVELTKGSCPLYFIPSNQNGQLDECQFSILSKVGTVNIKVKLFFA